MVQGKGRNGAEKVKERCRERGTGKEQRREARIAQEKENGARKGEGRVQRKGSCA